MSRRLLIVAPEFIPHPSPACHRARFLCRYAAANGWTTEVLSVRPEFYASPPDQELLRLLSPDVTITRTAAFRLSWTRKLGVTDTGLISYWHQRRALREIIAARRPSMLFISGPVFYSFPLGAYVRDRYGIPYVLDFTDPWVPNLTGAQNRLFSKARLARGLGRLLEPGSVRNAAHVIAVSEATNDEIRARYPDVDASRFSAFPFGFEKADYDVLRRHPRPNPHWDRNDGRFHFVYAGAMLPHGFETLRALFGALRLLRSERPRLFERLRVHFFGTTYDPRATEGRVMPVAREMDLMETVTEHPRRIPYIDALNVMTSADAVLAMGSTEHHYSASKIFPCLLASRPLLALYHSASNVCDTMRAAGTGELVTYDDVARAEHRTRDIADAIVRIVSRPESYPAPQLEGLQRYSAESMSAQLYALMDSLIEKRDTRVQTREVLAHA